MTTDKQLDILHDHYKETFTRLREVERSRDRLFLLVIGLFALLAVEIGYPAQFGGSVQSFSLLGAEINLGALPLPALLNATWVLTLAIALRYCQTSIWVDRHYPYVHLLEETISPLVGGGNLYQREGRVYLDRYPLALNAAWYAYVWVFPLVALIATAGLIFLEWDRLPYPWFHRGFDTIVGATILLCFFLYRVQPYVSEKCRTAVEKCRSTWRRWTNTEETNE